MHVGLRLDDATLHPWQPGKPAARSHPAHSGRDGATQTPPVAYSETGTQPPLQRDATTHVAPALLDAAWFRIAQAQDLTVYGPPGAPQRPPRGRPPLVGMPPLDGFLARVEAPLSRQLLANLATFEVYRALDRRFGGDDADIAGAVADHAGRGRAARDAVQPQALWHRLPEMPSAATLAGMAAAAAADADADGTCDPDPLRCSSLAVDATGTHLALGIAHAHHTAWCDHPGDLQVLRLGMHAAEPHEVVLQTATDHCVTALVFHPQEPAWLVGGGYDGRLWRWQLGGPRHGECVAAPRADGHDEPVRFLTWCAAPRRPHAADAAISDPDPAAYLLSGDDRGRLIVWALTPQRFVRVRSSQLRVSALTAALPPRTVSSRVADAAQAQAHLILSAVQPLDGSAGGEGHLAVDAHGATRLVVASPIGYAIEITTRGLAPAGDEQPTPEAFAGASAATRVFPPTAWTSASSALASAPASAAAAPLLGSQWTLGLAASPFCANLFLQARTGNTLSLHSALAGHRGAIWSWSVPAAAAADAAASDALFRDLTCVAWSPFFPLVFVCGTDDGALAFFDLRRADDGPCAVWTVPIWPAAAAAASPARVDEGPPAFRPIVLGSAAHAVNAVDAAPPGTTHPFAARLTRLAAAHDDDDARHVRAIGFHPTQPHVVTYLLANGQFGQYALPRAAYRAAPSLSQQADDRRELMRLVDQRLGAHRPAASSKPS
ncbi:hypothetical protein CXG81DRAFT_25900 [Caulochytrium protostelioides]|uniref:WD40 repeat-like protein n=1 Tax=Caulochytrium protostelioides TaxID=1555241 RepID=A0A4P9X813_9FUNG|nr:hypothetical protein CXG81DRAFT_25900 [Caulochytrium protostelioides]|eukprot:RKP01406.1 hypothetical protein CXG81DRAFT_25900 [Caulochytrium protostelioides]